MKGELRHLNDLSLLPDKFFDKRPNSVRIGDYDYTLHPNIAPDTIIERLPSYPGFNGSVLHVKIGNAPPPRTNDLQRAYVNVERPLGNQIKGPWGYEFSFLLLNVPVRLDNSGASERPIYSMTSLLMRLPDSSYRAAGGIRLFSEGEKYYASVYRVNRPDRPPSSAATKVDSRKVQIEIGVKHGFRIELSYNPKDYDNPYIKAFLVKFSPDGLRKISYQFIGELPLDSDISEILGDITWLGAYVGVPVKDLELVSGEAEVFALK